MFQEGKTIFVKNWEVGELVVFFQGPKVQPVHMWGVVRVERKR